jgi:hypothetical protein
MAKEFVDIGSEFETVTDTYQWTAVYFKLTAEISKSGEAMNVCFNALDDAIL